MNRFNKGRGSRGGFTLIELLVVISIIVILTTIIVGVYFSAKSRSEEKKARAEMKAIELAIHNFYTDNSFYPPDSGDGSFEQNGLFVSLTQGSSMLSRLDINGDGKISELEYKELPERVQQIMGDFGEIDTNGDGFIDSSEQEAFRKDKKNYLEGAQVKDDGIGNLIAPINHPDPVWATNRARLTGFENDESKNYWLYNSSAPKHNPDSFDLYVFLRTDVDATVEMNSTIRTGKVKARMYLGNWPGDYMYEKY